MFCDSHAHLTSDELYSDLPSVVEKFRSAQVSLCITICTDRTTFERAEKHKNALPEMKLSFAVTPHDVERIGERDIHLVEDAAINKKLVAIGETGLDYYYQHASKAKQQEFFLRFIDIAKRHDLPLIIHCRDAFEDLFPILDKNFGRKEVLLHCFTGNLHQAIEAVSRGWKISFSGIITYPKSQLLRDVAAKIPLDSIFIETDSPFLAPQSVRGKRNEPANIVEIAKVVAEQKQISLEECAAATLENAKRFFRV